MSTNKQAVQLEVQSTEIADLKNRDETNKSKIATLEGIVEDYKASERELKELVAELEAKAREHEMMRRKLHNTIQELKGNIRVFCRVRPLLGEEKNPDNVSTNPFNYPPNCDNKNIDVAQNGRDGVVNGQKHAGSTLNFSFDRVFGPSSTQSEVFEEISQLVQSALDGYNTCIFTYGQTGSGKTFTMEGPGKGMADLGLVRSIAPLAATELVTFEAHPCASWSCLFAGGRGSREQGHDPARRRADLQDGQEAAGAGLGVHHGRLLP
jgi:kinesin family protein C1